MNRWQQALLGVPASTDDSSYLYCASTGTSGTIYGSGPIYEMAIPQIKPEDFEDYIECEYCRRTVHRDYIKQEGVCNKCGAPIKMKKRGSFRYGFNENST